GHADRKMTAGIHAGLQPDDQLRRVVDIAQAQHGPPAYRHPLNRLAPEPLLRPPRVTHPARIRRAALRPADTAKPTPHQRDRAVAVAVGQDPQGDEVVVACTVGVGLDLVPAAADARLLHAPSARLLLVVPDRDAHPVTRALAARLQPHAEVVTVPDEWRTLL